MPEGEDCHQDLSITLNNIRGEIPDLSKIRGKKHRALAESGGCGLEPGPNMEQ